MDVQIEGYMNRGVDALVDALMDGVKRGESGLDTVTRIPRVTSLRRYGPSNATRAASRSGSGFLFNAGRVQRKKGRWNGKV